MNHETKTQLEINPILKRIIKINPCLFAILILLIFTCAILLPFIAIWAINVLFQTAIAYSFLNWCAAAILIVLFNINASHS